MAGFLPAIFVHAARDQLRACAVHRLDITVCDNRQ